MSETPMTEESATYVSEKSSEPVRETKKKRKSTLRASLVENETTEMALSALQTQMKILAETVKDVKLSPVEAPRPGKSKLAIHRYEKKCMDRIADIERKIATTPKSSPIYLRLRKQKLA